MAKDEVSKNEHRNVAHSRGRESRSLGVARQVTNANNNPALSTTTVWERAIEVDAYAVEWLSRTR